MADLLNKTDVIDREIFVTRFLNHPTELVWKVWTEPEHIVKWWGPRGFTNTNETMEVKPGGIWKFTMHGPDGVDYPNIVKYLEVKKPELLVYNHGDEGKPEFFHVTLTLKEYDGGTLLSMHTIFSSIEQLNFLIEKYNALEGLKDNLEKLEEYLENLLNKIIKGLFMDKNTIIITRTFNSLIEEIWEAITNIDKMKLWYMPALSDFKPIVGFQTEFSITHKGNNFPHIWKVTEVIPFKKISYEWRYEGYPGNSLVTFELETQEDKTILTLTHTGLESFEPDKYPELGRKNFEEGWNSIINDLLGKYLDGHFN